MEQGEDHSRRTLLFSNLYERTLTALDFLKATHSTWFYGHSMLMIFAQWFKVSTNFQYKSIVCLAITWSFGQLGYLAHRISICTWPFTDKLRLPRMESLSSLPLILKYHAAAKSLFLSCSLSYARLTIQMKTGAPFHFAHILFQS